MKWRRLVESIERRIGEPGTADRARWIATAPAQDLVLLWQPGQESWTSDRWRQEGEAIRAMALAALDSTDVPT